MRLNLAICFAIDQRPSTTNTERGKTIRHEIRINFTSKPAFFLEAAPLVSSGSQYPSNSCGWAPSTVLLKVGKSRLTRAGRFQRCNSNSRTIILSPYTILRTERIDDILYLRLLKLLGRSGRVCFGRLWGCLGRGRMRIRWVVCLLIYDF